MRKQLALAAILGITIAISGCGTLNDKSNTNIQGAGNPGSQKAALLNESGWETIEVVNNRTIIAKLKQTVKATPERDKKAEEVKERQEFKDGLYGEPTDELAEAIAMQSVEGSIAPQTLEKIYGGYKGLEDAAVMFLENSNQNGERMGFWIGIKKADERLTKFVEEMQAKVDTGEIKAEYIHIYYSPHTTTENHALTNQAAQAVKRVQRQSENSSRGVFGTSVDTITGNIVIEHNFLSDEQKEQLRKQFPDRKIVFEQQGRMVPKEGEPDTFYPEKEFTDQPSKEGAYVMEVTADELLAIEAKGRVYSKTDGEEHYGATHFKFPEAAKKLKIGQRVIVEPNGPIMESYPGQGAALYITVLPEYKPAGANLSESQAVSKAITEAKKTSDTEILIIRDLSFDTNTKQWTVNFQYGFQNKQLEIKIAD